MHTLPPPHDSLPPMRVAPRAPISHKASAQAYGHPPQTI